MACIMGCPTHCPHGAPMCLLLLGSDVEEPLLELGAAIAMLGVGTLRRQGLR